MNISEWCGELIRQDKTKRLASLLIGGEKLELCTCCAQKKDGGFEIKKKVGGLEVRLEAKTYPTYNAVEWVMWLKNAGGENTPELSSIWTADVSWFAEKKEKLRQTGINGDRCNEENFLPFSYPLNVESKRRMTPQGGKSSSGEFPYFDLQDRHSGVIVAIGWSGQWLYELERTEEALELRVGLEDACFYLKPGEEVRLPRVLMKGYEGDETDGHNDYRRLILKHYSPQKADGSPLQLPAAIQCFDRYALKFDYWNTEAGQKEYVAHAARMKYLDTVWLDAAWFTGGFPNGVGNFTLRKGFPNGLRPVTEEAHRLGLKFLLWFEVERANYGSQIEREHPEWMIKHPDAQVDAWITSRDDQDVAPYSKAGLVNLGISEAQQYISRMLIDFMRQEGIDCYRQDFNTAPLRFWRYHDEEGRRGLTEIKHIMGLYRLWDDLREAFPGLLIDNCSGGGRRIDLETGMRAVPLWRSDTGCSPISEDTPSDMWNQNQSISLSRYLVYHSIAAWNAGAYEFRSAATNGIACQFDVFNPEFDFDGATACAEEFARLRNYWLGDFYPITSATLDDTTWSAFQFHDRNSGNGALLAFRRARSPYEKAVFAFKGVEKDAKYQLVICDEDRKITEETVCGEKLLAGLEVTLLKTRSSVTIEYRKI